MIHISEKELLQITGGGFSITIGALIGAGISFLIGLLDGYTRPYRCR